MKYLILTILFLPLTATATDYTWPSTDYGGLSATDYSWPEPERKGGRFDALRPATSPVRKESPATLYVYSADYCPACGPAITRLENEGFDVQVIKNLPSWVEALPTITWLALDGKWKFYEGLDDSKLEQIRETIYLPDESANLEAGAQPTPFSEVHRILALLKPQQSETFVDYGCGDGRFCIAASSVYGCRSVGVEIDPERAAEARQRVDAAGLSHLVTIVEGDATQVNVVAQVGVVYLFADVLEKLKPKLEKLDRFASHQHQVPGLPMTRNGDSFLWDRSSQQQVQYAAVSTGRGVVYQEVEYTAPVCNSKNCSMCNFIRNGLKRKR